MGDSSLGLMFEISTDPSKAVAGVEAFSGQTSAALAKLEKQMASTTAVSRGMSTEFGQSMNFVKGAALQADNFGASMNAVTAAVHKNGAQMAEARHAIRGVGEELGIHMPQFVSNYISSLSGVAPAMAAAFSGVAVFAIIQMVAEQLPAAYKKLEGAITGWSEKAQKEYDKVLEKNREAVEAAQQFALDMQNVGKTPAEAAANALAAANLSVAEIGERIKTVNREMDDLRRKSREAMGSVSIFDETGGAASSSAYQAQIEELGKKLKILQAMSEKAVTERLARERAATIASDEKIHTDRTAAAKQLSAEGAAMLDKSRSDAIAEEMRRREAIDARRKKDIEDEKRETQEAVTFIDSLREKSISEEMADRLRADERKKRERDEERADEEKAVAYMLEIRERSISEEMATRLRADEQKRRTLALEEQAVERSLQRQMSVLHQLAGVTRSMFSSMSNDARRWADVTQAAVMTVITAILLRNMHEKQDIISISALKGAHYAAQAIADLGSMNFWAAAKHGAAAAMFFAVAATPVISAGLSGGFGGQGGSFGGDAGGVAAGGGPRGPVAMAPGSQRPGMGGTVHVIVSSNDKELANHIGGILTHSVRYGGGQLIASHVNG